MQFDFIRPIDRLKLEFWRLAASMTGFALAHRDRLLAIWRGYAPLAFYGALAFALGRVAAGLILR